MPAPRDGASGSYLSLLTDLLQLAGADKAAAANGGRAADAPSQSPSSSSSAVQGAFID
jgi:hypothetical protein